jgi:hypothetical protein
MKPVIFKILGISFLFIKSMTVLSQVAAVKFIVNVPYNDSITQVYLAGSFNYWHEHDSLYRLSEIGKGMYTITIPVFEGKTYYYKYTRGSWGSVEVAANDSNIANRRFLSLNQQRIHDTVIKWNQPWSRTTDSSAQLKKLVAMKDSLMAKLKPEMDSVQERFKSYVKNMLQENPDKGIHEKLDDMALRHIGKIYKGITLLLWNICTGLSPEQKKQVLKAIDKPANGDFINSFLDAVKSSVE